MDKISKREPIRKLEKNEPEEKKLKLESGRMGGDKPRIVKQEQSQLKPNIPQGKPESFVAGLDNLKVPPTEPKIPGREAMVGQEKVDRMQGREAGLKTQIGQPPKTKPSDIPPPSFAFLSGTASGNISTLARNFQYTDEYTNPMTVGQSIKNWISGIIAGWLEPSISSGLAANMADKLGKEYELVVDRKNLEIDLKKAARSANQRIDTPFVEETLSLIAFSLGVNKEAAKVWLSKIQNEVEVEK